MSIDRNAKDPLRLRRNQQRLRVGDNTNSIKVSPTGGITNGVSGLAISTLTTKGDVFSFSTKPARLAVGSDGQVLSADSTQTTGLKWVNAGAGTVTSVGLSLPGIFTVTGTPVTTTGTLTATLAVQNKNKFWCGPATGADAAPTFRVLDAADLGLTAKGDVLTFSTVLARLGVGGDGTVLTADSAQTTGLKWASAAGGSPFSNSTTITIATGNISTYPLAVVATGNSAVTPMVTGIAFASDTSATAAHVPGAAIWYTEIPNVNTSVGTLDIGVRYQPIRTSGMISAVTFAADSGGGSTRVTFNSISTFTANTLRIVGSSLVSVVPTTFVTPNGTATSSTMVYNSGVTVTLPSNTALNVSGTASVLNGGVSSQIGSVLFSNTTVSTAVTAATDTNFNRSVTLPAFFFTAGKAIRVRGIITFNSDLASTFTSNLKFGSVVLDTRILTPVVSGTGLRAYFDVILTCYTTGVSGAIARMGSFMGEQQVNNPAQNQIGPIGGGTVTVDTTSSQVVQFSASFSATSVTNTATLSQILVESLN